MSCAQVCAGVRACSVVIRCSKKISSLTESRPESSRSPPAAWMGPGISSAAASRVPLLQVPRYPGSFIAAHNGCRSLSTKALRWHWAHGGGKLPRKDCPAPKQRQQATGSPRRLQPSISLEPADAMGRVRHHNPHNPSLRKGVE